MLKKSYDKFSSDKCLEFSINGQVLGSFEYDIDFDGDINISNLHLYEDSHKGKGYGTQMVKELVEFLKKRYPNHSITLTTELNNFPAIGAYLKNGFIPYRIAGDTWTNMVYNDSSPRVYKMIADGKRFMKKRGEINRNGYLCNLLSTNKDLHYIFNKLKLNLDKKLWEHWDNERA